MRHHIVLAKVARRVRDDAVLSLLRLMLKASGRQGVPQGGVISPLLSNVYLTEVDTMLERAKAVTRYEQWTSIEYARFADDLVVLVANQIWPATNGQDDRQSEPRSRIRDCAPLSSLASATSTTVSVSGRGINASRVTRSGNPQNSRTPVR